MLIVLGHAELDSASAIQTFSLLMRA